MQSDNSASQLFDPGDFIREGYTVRVSESQTFIVPNALEGEDLPLAKVLKPDFSKAVEMAGGVSVLQNGAISTKS